MLRHSLGVLKAKHRQTVSLYGQSLGVLEDCFRKLSTQDCRFFSSEKIKESTDDGDVPERQPFVTAHLEPGEWDRERKDPIYRPKYRSHSKLISAEDFANRPPVAFDDDFETYEDGMITLSWMDQATCRQIYHLYVDMMVLSHHKHGRTSHEYVTKVIAQKFGITPWRAACIIQLQHNEEQMRQKNPELLAEEQGRYAEEMILKNIKDAYRSQRTEMPRYFVETPVGVHGRGEPDETSSQWRRTEDLFDIDEKLEAANVRDAKRARMIIDGHIYEEDVDDNQVEVKVDSNCHRLIKSKKALDEKMKKETGDVRELPYPETNGDGVKRPRWKYVAKVVDTRLLKKKGKKYKTYTNNNKTNTLVEQDGELRVATVEEAKHVAWKEERKDLEFVYKDAKKAWLNKVLNGKTDVWGRAPITKASQPIKSDTGGVQGGGNKDMSSSAATEAKNRNKPTEQEATKANTDNSGEKNEDVPNAGESGEDDHKK